MSFLTLVVVVVVHSTRTSRSIWPMHKTNRTLGIPFKWALVVFIVCCVSIFFTFYVLALTRTDAKLFQDICQISKRRSQWHAQLTCSLLSEQEAKAIRPHKKGCCSKDYVLLGRLDGCTTSVNRLRFPQLLFSWPLLQEHRRNMRCWEWTEAKVSRSDLPPWRSPPHLRNTL